MNTSGLFVAPKTGKYFFILSGISDVNAAVRVKIQIKTDTDSRLDESHTRQRNWSRWLSRICDRSHNGTGKGNQIRILLVEGASHDNIFRYTNLVGQLIEEEIVE